MKKGYVEFIADLKQRIVQSRYIAARLANREQLMLYLSTGPDKAMGVATYRTTREMPAEMRGILPDRGELAGVL